MVSQQASNKNVSSGLTLTGALKFVNRALLVGATGLTGFDRFGIKGAVGGVGVGLGLVGLTNWAQVDQPQSFGAFLSNAATESLMASVTGSLMASSLMKGATIPRILRRVYPKSFGGTSAGELMEEMAIAQARNLGLDEAVGRLGGFYSVMPRAAARWAEKKWPGELGKYLGRSFENITGSPYILDKVLHYGSIQEIPAKEYILANTKDVFAGAGISAAIGLPFGALGYGWKKWRDDSGKRRMGRQLPAPVTSFSGFDDEYNTIEGLGHEGIAWRLRRQNTDFGSGFTRILRRLISSDPNKARVLGARIISRSDVESYLHRELSESLAKAIDDPKQFESFVKSFRGAPRKLSEEEILGSLPPKHRLLEKLHDRGARERLSMLGGNPEEYIDLFHGTSLANAQRLLASRRIEAEAEPVFKSVFYHSKPEAFKDRIPFYSRRATEAFKPLGNVAEAIEAVIHTRIQRKFVAKNPADYAGGGDELLVQEKFFQHGQHEILAKGSRFSGFDKEWNTIVGMQEGGLAEWLRKQKTPFGSPWDPLRAIAKEVVGVTKKSWARNAAKLSEEAYTSFLEGAAFQRTLIQSNKVIRGLGAGTFGRAELMETTFGGKKFQYVRKTPLNEEGVAGAYGEYRKMRQLQAFGVPTPYGLVAAGPAKGTIYMEYIPGREAKGLWETGELTAGHVQQIESTLKEAHTRGFAHFDIWRRVQGGELKPYNVRVTPQGQVAVIDWGAAKPARQTVGEMFQQGPVVGAAGIVDDPAFLPMTAAETDLMLGESLNRQLGAAVNRASQQVAPVAPDALSGVASVVERRPQARIVPPPSQSQAVVQASLSARNIQQRHADLSQILRRDQERVWNNARSGGSKHRGPEAFASTVVRDAIVDAIGFANTLIR